MRNWKALLLVFLTLLLFAVFQAFRETRQAPEGRARGSQSAMGTVGRMGLFVEQVLPHSPAEAAGIEAGDILFRINVTPLESRKHLGDVLRNAPVGSTLTVHLLRYNTDLSAWEPREASLKTTRFDELQIAE